MANNDSSLVISRETLKSPYVISEKLHSVLSSVSELEPIATLHEILEGLKKYILREKLYSPVDPSKIVCKTDELRTVFGVSEFSIKDLKQIMQKLIVPQVNHVSSFSHNSGAKGDGAIKRTSNVDLVKDDESVGAKRFCDPSNSQQNFRSSSTTSTMFLHIPSTPEQCDCSDLPESIQGYETEYVKDSSDIALWSDSENDFFSDNGDTVATADVFDIEYEVEYSSENSRLPSGTDTDNEEVIVGTAAIISVLQKDDSDFEFWADQSAEGEEDEDDDLEISVSDRWLCKNCGSLNNPRMRLCLTCCNQRAGWLPEKKKDIELRKMSFRKKRQTARDKKQSRNPCAKSSEHHFEDSSNSDEDTKDSDCPPESQIFLNSSQETINSIGRTRGLSQSASASSLLNGMSSSCLSLQTSGFGGSQTEMTPDSAGLSQGSSLSLSQNDYNSSSLSLYSNDFLSSARSADYCLQLSRDKSVSSSELGASCSSPFESFSILNSYDDCNYPSSQERLNDLSISSSQTVILPFKGDSPLDPSTGEKLCIICCSSPALGSIIHGKFAHQVTCYRCARTLQKQKKLCPICRRTIQKVVHQIV